MDAVDTNVLVRLTLRDDDEQVRLAEEVIADGVWISHLVLAEMTWVLRRSYGLGHDEVAEVVAGLLHHEQITIQAPHVVIEALRLYRLRPSLGFGDCLILEIARDAGRIPLRTFDRDLANVHGAKRIA